MTKPIETIIDVETNEVIERELTKAEIDVLAAEGEKIKQAQQKAIDDALAARALAEAKLATIGLSPSDLKALGL